jgi:xylulokinase
MSIQVVLGVDIGTSSSKGILVDLSGTILRTAVREHVVSRPAPGQVEMDADIWWSEFAELSLELLAKRDVDVQAVGVSGMGPCVMLTDETNRPLRPAILYGVDTRATEQIERLTREIGAENIVKRGGSALSTQAVGPKLAWISEHEPQIWKNARKLYMPSSWLVHNLTGNYVLDHHSASQCSPLYDTVANTWFRPWTEKIAPDIALPKLAWPGDQAGTITEEAASFTGLPAGIPVITGTIDAWAEAVSVGAQGNGDLMLMYGTTMFLINTVPEQLTSPTLWSTVGALPGTRNLAGGMATSGAITSWLRELFGSPEYSQLIELAATAGAGSNGLLMLPYFAGERTPIPDADARGIIAGLTVTHTQGDIYRAALEATAMGVRHNVDAMLEAGATITRTVAVGGGTQGTLWTQIVSDVTGLAQVIPTHTVGASFGVAFLAAQLVSDAQIDVWNPAAEIRLPAPEHRELYDDLYQLYLSLYTQTLEISHALARLQSESHIDAPRPKESKE